MASAQYSRIEGGDTDGQVRVGMQKPGYENQAPEILTRYNDVQDYLNAGYKIVSGQETLDSFAAAKGISSPTSSNSTGSTPTEAGQQANEASQMTDQEFKNWLNSQNLSSDQKSALQAVYDSISVNDVARAQQVTEAMAAAAQYSDPYFKAQISLVTDALARGLASDQGDLQFQTQSLQRSLQALRDDIAASKDYLSFQNRQELEALARKYELDIENNTNAMAATGFTQSSRRARTEGFISDAYGNAVESSNRSLAYQTGRLNRQLSTSQADTAAQIANLQRLVQEGKIDALRKAEEQVGTTNLQSLGYTGLLGNVGGEIPRQQVQDMTNFAGAFAF